MSVTCLVFLYGGSFDAGHKLDEPSRGAPVAGHCSHRDAQCCWPALGAEQGTPEAQLRMTVLPPTQSWGAELSKAGAFCWLGTIAPWLSWHCQESISFLWRISTGWSLEKQEIKCFITILSNSWFFKLSHKLWWYFMFSLTPLHIFILLYPWWPRPPWCST